MEQEDYPGAGPFVPESRSLEESRLAVQSCRGCDLYRDSTQAVFGDGPPTPRLMLVRRAAGRP